MLVFHIQISNYASIVFMVLFLTIAGTGILEMQWGGVGIDDWWRNEQFWVIGGVSAHLFALFQGLLKVLAGVDTNFIVTSKGADDGEYSELYPLFGKLFFAIWVILHLFPFLKGMMWKQEKLPTILIVWFILLSSILTLVWVRINPFVNKDVVFLSSLPHLVFLLLFNITRLTHIFLFISGSP